MSNGMRVDAVSGGGFCCHVHVSRHYNLCNRVTGNLRTAEHRQFGSDHAFVWTDRTRPERGHD